MIKFNKPSTKATLFAVEALCILLVLDNEKMRRDLKVKTDEVDALRNDNVTLTNLASRLAGKMDKRLLDSKTTSEVEFLAIRRTFNDDTPASRL